MRTMPTEVYPVNFAERVYVMMFMFFAFSVFAICVTKITSTFNKISQRKTDFDEHMAALRVYLRDNKVPRFLQERMKAYLEHVFHKRRIMAREKICISELSSSLRAELQHFLLGPTLLKLRIFQTMPS